MPLIDTHVHLDFPDFDPDRAEVIQRAHAADVTRMISIGTRLDTSERAIKLAEENPSIWATVGIHPNAAAETPDDFLDEIRRLAQNKRVVALGEIGLDYHHLPSRKMQNPLRNVIAAEIAQDPESITRQIADDSCKNRQAIFFREQLDLAVELGLNAVIHQRDAWNDTLKILEDYTGRVKGVFHCFGGTPAEAAQVIALGHLVSFTGIVTFKNAPDVHAAACAVPENKFMVETDCPYLAPMPNRGKRCEPAYTRLVAERIAELRGVTLEKIAESTCATAEAFFRFKR